MENKANRRSPRRPFLRPVGLLVGGHYVVLSGRQISEGGMSISLGKSGAESSIEAQQVPVGQQIAVTFLISQRDSKMRHIGGTSGENKKEESFSLRGEIIYHDIESGPGLHLGIKFIGVDLHQKRVIRAFTSTKKTEEAHANGFEGLITS